MPPDPLPISGVCLRPKKAEASEQEIQLNEERLERILRFLSSISKQLKAQLRRKTLLTGTRVVASRDIRWLPSPATAKCCLPALCCRYVARADGQTNVPQPDSGGP